MSLHNRFTSWNNAEKQCKERGGHLFSLTIFEDEVLVKFVQNQLLETGWQTIGEILYVGLTNEQVREYDGYCYSPFVAVQVVLRT